MNRLLSALLSFALAFFLTACGNTEGSNNLGAAHQVLPGDDPGPPTAKSLLLIVLESTPERAINSETMPYLAGEFVPKARVWGRHYIPGSWTCTGVGSLVLGRFPWKIDPDVCHGTDSPYPTSVQLLSDILGDVGYKTHFLNGNRVAGTLSGLGEGHFDLVEETASDTHTLMQRAFTIMRERKGELTYIQVHLMQPHDPHNLWATSCSATAASAAGTCEELTGFDFATDESKNMNSLELSPEAQEVCAEAAEVTQSCEITSLDETAFPELFTILKPTDKDGEGLGEEWYVAVTTDHGESWGNLGLDGGPEFNHNQGLQATMTHGFFAEWSNEIIPEVVNYVATNQVYVTPHLLR